MSMHYNCDPEDILYTPGDEDISLYVYNDDQGSIYLDITLDQLQDLVAMMKKDLP